MASDAGEGRFEAADDSLSNERAGAANDSFNGPRTGEDVCSGMESLSCDIVIPLALLDCPESIVTLRVLPDGAEDSLVLAGVGP